MARRPPEWDRQARAKLRAEAEAGKVAVELKPCDRAADVVVALKP